MPFRRHHGKDSEASVLRLVKGSAVPWEGTTVPGGREEAKDFSSSKCRVHGPYHKLSAHFGARRVAEMRQRAQRFDGFAELQQHAPLLHLHNRALHNAPGPVCVSTDGKISAVGGASKATIDSVSSRWEHHDNGIIIVSVSDSKMCGGCKGLAGGSSTRVDPDTARSTGKDSMYARSLTNQL